MIHFLDESPFGIQSKEGFFESWPAGQHLVWWGCLITKDRSILAPFVDFMDDSGPLDLRRGGTLKKDLYTSLANVLHRPDGVFSEMGASMALVAT